MSLPRARFDQFRLAMMLLTRLPVGRISGAVPAMDKARWAFPLVGLVIGGIGWGVFAAAVTFGLSSVIAAILALLATALATGGMHFDGLADFADGWGGGSDRARTLEIMRDSRIGSYGVLALILFSALLAAGISEVASATAFLLAGVGSRLAMLLALVFMPPARADGLGRMAAGKGEASLIAGTLVCAVLVILAGTTGAFALIGAGLAMIVIGHSATRRIGGQTGDVLGAIQLASETAIWIFLATSAH
ncbi:adenosylcobinamide-GDP ribazoletransferase [Thioclava sp. A2]|uniref:adenosylcobinamide-GDP ribazoletransferase n=1 Tax=Thioclava sp. FCG-A2 TaxID=3080562 RepID=UPI002954EC0A|nr:adenosylcobinamide-GDP ribazoletransferase [Thioclava sp. A2]MDV7269722.1 adenosylcobinamide-GDP ribazoletransferase [Thioclava sp. A2]